MLESSGSVTGTGTGNVYKKTGDTDMSGEAELCFEIFAAVLAAVEWRLSRLREGGGARNRPVHSVEISVQPRAQPAESNSLSICNSVFLDFIILLFKFQIIVLPTLDTKILV